jgi:hypothetical protein
MGFLNSLLLLFGGFALVPILIHLLNRQRVKLVYFSSLKYLKSLQKTRMRRLKVKQILLLLLRMLIVALIVFAFARPALESAYTAGLGAAAKTSVVVLLDNSLSMSAESKGRSLFEKGRDFAARLLGVAGEGDEVAASTFNADVTSLTNGFSLDVPLAGNMIAKSNQSFFGTDPVRALGDALDRVASSRNLRSEIFIVSDFSEHGWEESFSGGSVDSIQNCRIYLAPVTDPEPDNVKVIGVDFGRQLIYPGRPLNIRASLNNDCSRAVPGVLASLYVDGSRVSQADCDLPPSGSVEVGFTYTFSRPGLHHGFVEIPDDALMADNRYYFTVSIPDAIAVLVVGERESDNLYVSFALKPRPDTPTQINCKSIGLGTLAGEDPYQYDCVVLNGIKYLSESSLSAVDNFVASGGGLLLFLPPGGDMKSYGARVTKKRFDAELIGPLSAGQGEFFTLSRLSTGHPIFSRYAEVDSSSLPVVKFREIVRLEQSRSNDVLAWYSNGSPAVLETLWGQGKAILFAGDLRLESGELVRHPLFVTFVNRAVEYLASDMTRVAERYVAGGSAERRLDRFKPGTSLDLLAPDGSRSILAPNAVGKDATVSIQRLSNPGIYRVVAADSLVDMFAVNVDTKETTQRYVDPSRIMSSLQGFDPVLLPTDGDRFLEVVRENRHGREIWKPILILAILLLGLEMVIARSDSSAE